VSASWNERKPAERSWKPDSGLDRSARSAEQDDAAGGRACRFTSDGALASIALRVQPRSRRIYAYLRWSSNGKTKEKFVREVNCDLRRENLVQAWIQAKSDRMVLASGSYDSWAGDDAVRAVMRANKGRDTGPELELRRSLYAQGMRYRVNYRHASIPRRSIDIAFVGSRVAVFVDGCYWHGCSEHYRPSRSNEKFWSDKITSNAARDRDTEQRLTAAGWRVVRFWEHHDMALASTEVAQILVSRLRSEIRSR
jgi:DNA mismatch endonuclease, patch repair protein